MKCINCGFESNDKYCPMCGATLFESVNTVSNNPYENVQQSSMPTPPPYTQQPQGMPTPPPYTQQPQGMPTSPHYAQQPQGMPTPPHYAQQPQDIPAQPTYTYDSPQPLQPKKQSKTLPTVLTIIVCSVIVIGTIINIVSSIAFKSSIYDIFDDITDSYDDINYDDMYYDDFESDEDSVIHKMNEASEFKYGKVTLTNVEITKDKFEFADSICECAFTFEIENTTDEKIQFSVPSVQVCSNNGDYYEDCYEWLYDDYESADTNYDFTVEAGETKKFVTYYKVPTDKGNFSIMFDINDYDYTYDFICYFEASLPQAETTAPATTKPAATEPATKKPTQ